MTDTELANNALRLIGHSPILDIDSTVDDTAVTCKQLLTSCKLFMLADGNWNQARDRKYLSMDTTAPAFGYLYRYAKPSDSLVVIETNDSGYPWDSEGGYILTDAPTLGVVYIKNLPIANFAPAMVTALETLLASRLSSALLHDDVKAEAKYGLYRIIVSDAKAIDGMEGTARQAWAATGAGSIRQARVG